MQSFSFTQHRVLGIILNLLLLSSLQAFVTSPPLQCPADRIHRIQPRRTQLTSLWVQQSVLIDSELTEEKIRSLFAWISRAFAGEPEYNNLILAIVSIFGTITDDKVQATVDQMIQQALSKCPEEDELCGEPFSTDDREIASLGAMGVAQWTGNYRTRPHSLLTVSNLTSVDEWVSSLPRGCRRTIKRALDQNYSVTTKPIVGGESAPHSSLAHFRCVVEHEVRLLADDSYGFVDALQEAMGRWMGTTKMAGEIREYRNENGTVIALAHEVRKGSTMRGQWFYQTDEASKRYVWFHAVYDLVQRAIASEGVQVVDLGPSGSDAFTELKEKYGFESIDEWTQVADYRGSFFYEGGRPSDGTNKPTQYENQLERQSSFLGF